MVYVNESMCVQKKDFHKARILVRLKIQHVIATNHP